MLLTLSHHGVHDHHVLVDLLHHLIAGDSADNSEGDCQEPQHVAREFYQRSDSLCNQCVNDHQPYQASLLSSCTVELLEYTVLQWEYNHLHQPSPQLLPLWHDKKKLRKKAQIMEHIIVDCYQVGVISQIWSNHRIHENLILENQQFIFFNRKPLLFMKHYWIYWILKSVHI